MSTSVDHPVIARRTLGIITLIAGVLGLIASFDLSFEAHKLAQNPDHIAACDLSSIVSCSSIMKEPQASLFGFPNSHLGVVAYLGVIGFAVWLLTRRSIPRPIWWVFLVGNIVGLLFMHLLVWFSVFKLGALCPWCMLVWIVTIPLAVYSFLYALSSDAVGANAKIRRTVSSVGVFHPVLLIVWIGSIAVLVLTKFSYVLFG